MRRSNPEKVAELIVERAATWVPAPTWAVVAAEPTGQLVVLADQGLAADLGRVLTEIAEWVMHHGEEFLSANLRNDERIRTESMGRSSACRSVAVAVASGP